MDGWGGDGGWLGRGWWTVDGRRWTVYSVQWKMDGRWTVDGDGGGGGSRRWTVEVDGGRWTVDGGRWTVDGGRWTVDGGRWTVDGGRYDGTLDGASCMWPVAVVNKGAHCTKISLAVMQTNRGIFCTCAPRTT